MPKILEFDENARRSALALREAHDPSQVSQETTASTSRAERISSSSPEYLTSVPPYLL